MLYMGPSYHAENGCEDRLIYRVYRDLADLHRDDLCGLQPQGPFQRNRFARAEGVFD